MCCLSERSARLSQRHEQAGWAQCKRHDAPPENGSLTMATELDPGQPTMLDHSHIEALVPHRGAMCLLERMVSWSPTRIVCVATNHRDPTHPLRSRSGLLASAAIEYAAQAAALHGGLMARAADGPVTPGYLASARDVQLTTWRLDNLGCAIPDELQIVAECVASDTTRLMYTFSMTYAERELASGRLTVVLNPTLGLP